MKNLIVFFITILVASCGKDRTIHIHAINPATGEALAGLPYSVKSSRTTASGEKYRTEASGNLDGNGEAHVTVKQRTGRTYGVSVNQPANTCYANDLVQYFNSPNDLDGSFVFEYAECAELQLKVQNIDCIDANDKIEISMDNNVHSLLTVPWFLYGCVDQSYAPESVPVGVYFLNWTVTKNNTSQTFSDSFVLIENQQKMYEIEF